VWGEEPLSMGSDPEHKAEEESITVPSSMVSMKDGIMLSEQAAKGAVVSLQMKPAVVPEDQAQGGQCAAGIVAPQGTAPAVVANGAVPTASGATPEQPATEAVATPDDKVDAQKTSEPEPTGPVRGMGP